MLKERNIRDGLVTRQRKSSGLFVNSMPTQQDKGARPQAARQEDPCRSQISRGNNGPRQMPAALLEGGSSGTAAKNEQGPLTSSGWLQVEFD